VTTSDATSEASETLQRAHRPEQKQLRGTADQTPGKAGSTASAAGDTFLRARRPEQKLQRREEILAAARELALLGGVRGVSLAGIAAKAGIDKSALLRYFETREQIFLELTAREWAPWLRSLHDGLDGVAPGSADAAPGSADAAPGSPNAAPGSPNAAPGSPETADLVADVVARSFGDRPLFCDLLAHTPLNLERNVSPEAVRAYKLISLGAVGEAADVVYRALPYLTEQECREFISVIASLAGNLWQIANPVPALAAMFAADPALSLACIDLVPRLRRTGEVLLAGFIPSREASRRGLPAGRDSLEFVD
jgi:AcrR family transcriptional regulator